MADTRSLGYSSYMDWDRRVIGFRFWDFSDLRV